MRKTAEDSRVYAQPWVMDGADYLARSNTGEPPALGPRVVVLAGDGGTYDIGFQCLSSAAERNEDFIYICLDNEGYMNAGAQKSSSTPHLARTGSTPAGKTSRKKNLIEIMAAHESRTGARTRSTTTRGRGRCGSTWPAAAVTGI